MLIPFYLSNLNMGGGGVVVPPRRSHVKPWWEYPQKRIYDIIHPVKTVEVLAENIEEIQDIPEYVREKIDEIAANIREDEFEEVNDVHRYVSDKLSTALVLSDLSYRAEYLEYLYIRLRLMDDEEAILLLLS